MMFKECRRKKLITYFNPEEAGLVLCDDCHICKDSVANTPLTNDYTPQITRIIALLRVVERPITIKYLAQVASGKMSKKIRENRDEHSSIFSIFKCTVNACELFLRRAVTKDILREVPPAHGVNNNCSYLQLKLGSQYLQYVSGQTKLMYRSL